MLTKRKESRLRGLNSENIFLTFLSQTQNGSAELIQKAGAMDRAKKLVTIRDTETESSFGYVFSVSGPGKCNLTQLSLLKR